MAITKWLDKQQAAARRRTGDPDFDLVAYILNAVAEGATLQAVADELKVDRTQLERQMARIGYIYRPGGRFDRYVKEPV